MTYSKREIYSNEAYYYYNDGTQALREGDINEANRCFEMAEGYLKDANIPYTGTGINLSWQE